MEAIHGLSNNIEGIWISNSAKCVLALSCFPKDFLILREK